MQVLPSFFVSVFFIAFMPYALILLLYKSGLLSDLQMPKRKERLLPLLAVNLCVLTGFMFLFFINSGDVLKAVYLIYMVGLPGLSLITMFYKVSFHSSYVTMFSLTYMIIFGKWAIFTLLLIPLVGWSRVRLKRHTISQVLIGIILSGTVSLTVFSLNGYSFYRYFPPGLMWNIFHIITEHLKYSFPGKSINMLFFFMMFALVLYLNMLIFSEGSYLKKGETCFLKRNICLFR